MGHADSVETLKQPKMWVIESASGRLLARRKKEPHEISDDASPVFETDLAPKAPCGFCRPVE
jgi:hypothetical protein